MSCKNPVRQGTQSEAQWYSYGVNQTHGLRRDPADIERAVLAALSHPKSQSLNNVEIAKHIGCRNQRVSEARRKLEASSQIGKIEKRQVTRGDKTYEQDTANIGKNCKRKLPAVCGRLSSAADLPSCEALHNDSLAKARVLFARFQRLAAISITCQTARNYERLPSDSSN